MPTSAAPAGGGNFLTHKLGPLPMWVWMLGAIGILYVIERRSSSSSSTTPTTTANTDQMAADQSYYQSGALLGLQEQLAALQQQLASSPAASSSGTGGGSSPSPGNGSGPAVSPGNTGNPGTQPVGGSTAHPPATAPATPLAAPFPSYVAPGAVVPGWGTVVDKGSNAGATSFEVVGPTTTGSEAFTVQGLGGQGPVVPVSQRVAGERYSPSGQVIY